MSFDDPSIAGTTVEAVLAPPDKYINKKLSDPFEGRGYGRGKAMRAELYERAACRTGKVSISFKAK